MAGTKTTEQSGSRADAAAEEPRAEQPSAQAGAAEREHVCNVAFCPIGLALSTMQGAAPDVLEHLLKAAQEFFLAARAVIDNRAKDLEGTPEEGGLQRIEIS
jgi:hypothetical protein